MSEKKPAKGKKGKGSKSKKEGKQEPRADKESDVERAKANAALWELRLNVTEQSLTEWRESALRLARANEDLSNLKDQAEKDMFDVMTHLNRKETEREEKIMSLEAQLKSQKVLAREERENLVSEYTLQINELEERFKKRAGDFVMTETELKKIKELKAQMEEELSSVRLEKEAEQRHAQLAECTRKKLDHALRSPLKENVRLNEALNSHVKEMEDLKKLNASLAADKETQPDIASVDVRGGESDGRCRCRGIRVPHPRPP